MTELALLHSVLHVAAGGTHEGPQTASQRQAEYRVADRMAKQAAASPENSIGLRELVASKSYSPNLQRWKGP